MMECQWTSKGFLLAHPREDCCKESFNRHLSFDLTTLQVLRQCQQRETDCAENIKGGETGEKSPTFKSTLGHKMGQGKVQTIFHQALKTQEV